jgi:hypothetical protein
MWTSVSAKRHDNLKRKVFFEMVKPPPKFHVCLQKVFALREDDSTVMVPEATCDHVAALEGV